MACLSGAPSNSICPLWPSRLFGIPRILLNGAVFNQRHPYCLTHWWYWKVLYFLEPSISRSDVYKFKGSAKIFLSWWYCMKTPNLWNADAARIRAVINLRKFGDEKFGGLTVSVVLKPRKSAISISTWHRFASTASALLVHENLKLLIDVLLSLQGDQRTCTFFVWHPKRPSA